MKDLVFDLLDSVNRDGIDNTLVGYLNSIGTQTIEDLFGPVEDNVKIPTGHYMYLWASDYDKYTVKAYGEDSRFASLLWATRHIEESTDTIYIYKI